MRPLRGLIYFKNKFSLKKHLVYGAFMPTKKALQEFTDLYFKKYEIRLEGREALEEMSDFFYIVAFASGRNHLLNNCSSLQYVDLE